MGKRESHTGRETREEYFSMNSSRRYFPVHAQTAWKGNENKPEIPYITVGQKVWHPHFYNNFMDLFIVSVTLLEFGVLLLLLLLLS